MTSNATNFYHLHPPTCYKRLRRNPFKTSQTIRISKVNVLDTTDMTTKQVFAKKCHQFDGYAFPYPLGNNKQPSTIVFAFLTRDHATGLIKMKSIAKQEYCHLLDVYAKYKQQFSINYVTRNGISLEECHPSLNNADCQHYLHNLNYMDVNKLHLRTKGRMHAMWKRCSTFTVEDNSIFKTLFERTYGNFGFTRSKTKCFGINAYLGKKNAEYV